MLNGDGALITEDGTRGPTRVKFSTSYNQGKKYWDGTADDGVVVAVGTAGIKPVCGLSVWKKQIQ